jgi:hypothetical protein
MDGRAFLAVAQRLAQVQTEADWRTAAGRAYYALMLECLETLQRWGFAPLPRDNVHPWVRLRLIYAANPDVRGIGSALEDLGTLRNQADYHPRKIGPFASPGVVQQAVVDAGTMISLLDQIERDPARQAAAIAAIRTTIP